MVRKAVAAVVVLVLFALPVFSRQEVGGIVGDTPRVVFLGKVFADTDVSSTDPIVRLWGEVPIAHTTIPLRLKFDSFSGIARVWVALNIAGEDKLIYNKQQILPGTILTVPAPPSGWLVGYHPVKVIVQYYFGSSPAVEVEQLLIEIKSPPLPCPLPLPPPPPLSTSTAATSTDTFYLSHYMARSFVSGNFEHHPS